MTGPGAGPGASTGGIPGGGFSPPAGGGSGPGPSAPAVAAPGASSAPVSCDFVVFGGTGDLALRKLLPALFLRDAEHLPLVGQEPRDRLPEADLAHPQQADDVRAEQDDRHDLAHLLHPVLCHRCADEREAAA